jgi:WD40-like Beta Propeller Repeat
MADLDDRFRSFARTRSPDLWSEIETREPRSETPPTPSWHRALAIAVALVVAAAGIGLASLTFGGSEQRPATGTSGTLLVPKANGEIWFRVGGGDGGRSIEAIEPNGSGRRTVISENDVSHRYSRISFSPDGMRIAFDDIPHGIVTTGADGSDPVRLTDGANDSWASWSPDGTRILFSSTRYDPSIEPCEPGFPYEFRCPTDIYVMDADGSNLVRLTSDPVDEFMPAWSPDGSRIAFVRNTAESSVSRPAIFSMRPDGSDVRQVSSGTGGSDWWPSWSPDGAQITFASIRNEDWGIWVADADGSGERRILGGEGMGYVDNPVWSPDGGLIAFVGNLTVDDYSPEDALYVMRPDGSDVTPLADAPRIGVAGDIAWQPIPVDVEPTPLPDAVVPTRAEVIETFGVGSDVRSVVYGDGSVWVATSNGDGSLGGRIVRIDPETHEVQADIPVAVIPTWEVGGGAMVVEDGSLWVTGGLDTSGLEGPSGAGLIRIDTSTNEVVKEFDLGGDTGADLTFVNGDLWVLLFGDQDTRDWMEIVRVDPATGDVTAGIALDQGWAHTIVAADDRLVVLKSGNGGTNVDGLALAIDPATSAVTRADIPSETFVPMPVVSRGQVWIGLEPGFARFDPLGGAFPEAPTSLDPSAVSCCGFLEADDRGIWFLSPDPDGGPKRHLQLFEPGSGQLHDLVAVHEGEPVAMALSPNAVWILNYEGTLTHVELH